MKRQERQFKEQNFKIKFHLNILMIKKSKKDSPTLTSKVFNNFQQNF